MHLDQLAYWIKYYFVSNTKSLTNVVR